MSDIVSDAKEWLERRPPFRPSQDGRTHYEGCHAEHTDCLIERLVAEVQRHRMTPEEREAAGECATDSYGVAINVVESDAASVTLRGYLARTAPEET